MAVNIADKYVLQETPVDFQTRSPVLAENYKELVEHQHLLWLKHGEKIGGWAFIPYFEPNDTSFTQTPANNVAPLNQIVGQIRSDRPNENGEWHLTLRAYGTDVDVRLTIIYHPLDWSDTVSASCGSDEWAVTNMVIDPSDGFPSEDSAPFMLSLEAAATDSESRLYQVEIHGSFISMS